MTNIQWGELAAFATVMTILFGVFYALMKRWFLDLETYKNDKLVSEEADTKLVKELKGMLSDMQKEKANADDLKKTEQRIEKLDSQIAGIMTTVEKQCYRMDLLIDNRADITDLVKELKRDVNSHLKDIKDDIARQDTKIVTMQLDVQDLKTRLS